jgi:hypothetical protein
MRSDMHGWPHVCIMRLVYFPLSKTLITITFMYENLVCNNLNFWTFV